MEYSIDAGSGQNKIFFLQDEMYSPSGDYSESRPFKIFISLLDKWEIGAALTEVLVYDAFKALKQFVESNPDNSEDVCPVHGGYCIS